MLRNSRALIILTLATVFTGSRAFGDLLPPSISSQAEAFVCPPSVDCNTPIVSSSGSPLVESLAAGGGTFSINGSASGSYGILKASTSASFSGATAPNYVNLTAFAESTDIMTISSPAFTGDAGLLAVNFTIDGSVSQSGSFTSAAAVLGEVNGLTQVAIFPSSTSQIHTFPMFFKFIYGTPFNIEFELIDAVGTYDLIRTGDYTSPPFPVLDITGVTTTQAGSGSADFGDTFVLSGLHVFDSQMNPVEDATFTSGSGTQYTQNGVVPEPSSWLLLLSALLLCTVTRRGRRATRHEGVVFRPMLRGLQAASYLKNAPDCLLP